MSQQKLGRYELVRVLGKGAMGLVYEGRDPNLDRRVAIKTIKVENLSDEEAAEYEVRFRTEARSAARLQHPNIVSVYDSDRHGDIAYLVMEFIEGQDLKHHLDSGIRYTLQQTVAIMGDLLLALDYAHRQNIVHRDIKPANLLIEASGRVKLTDFGVARIQDASDSTRTQGTMVGTLKYMSPEQIQGRSVDSRADVFAAGIVLYQLLTGLRPFDGGSDFDVIQQIVGKPALPPSAHNAELPPELDLVVARALAKSRDERWSTAGEFYKALIAAVGMASNMNTAPATTAASGTRSATWTSTMQPSDAISGTQPGSSMPSAAVTQEVELVYWKEIKESLDPDDFNAFLVKFPTGIYADLATRRLKRLLSATGGDSTDSSVTGTRLITKHEPTSKVPTTENNAHEAAAAPLPSTKRVDEEATMLDAWPETVFQGTEDNIAPPPASVAAAGTAAGAAEKNVANHASARTQSRAAVNAGTSTAKPKAKTAQASGKPFSTRFWVLGSMLLASVLLAFASRFWNESTPVVPAVDLSTQKPAQAASAPASAASAPSSSATAASAALEASSAASAAAGAASTATLAASSASSPTSNPIRQFRDAAKPPKSTAPKDSSKASAPITAAVDAASNPAHSVSSGKSMPPEDTGKPTHEPPEQPSNPKVGCEGRVFIGYQLCMTEQCRKPQFTNHPVCAERRVMEQRNQENNR